MAVPIENIIRYLENEMSAEERAKFEAIIQKDETLAEEVEFQRKLHGFLKRRQPKIESQLSDLGDKYIVKQPSKKDLNIWGVSVILLALFGIFYYLFFIQKTEVPIEQKISPIENLNPVKIDSIQPDSKENIEKPTSKTKKQKIPKSTKKTNNQPIAQRNEVDYLPNPLMEDLFQNQYRNLKIQDTFELNTPSLDTIYKFEAPLNFSIKAETSVAPPYQLIIYSNKNEDIENDIRIFEQAVSSVLVESLYQIDFQTNLSLKRGLYYMIIQKRNSRNILSISKFSIE